MSLSICCTFRLGLLVTVSESSCEPLSMESVARLGWAVSDKAVIADGSLRIVSDAVCGTFTAPMLVCLRSTSSHSVKADMFSGARSVADSVEHPFNDSFLRRVPVAIRNEAGLKAGSYPSVGTLTGTAEGLFASVAGVG